MKTAAEWIEEGKNSITRIAVELGYDNFHYFAKVFAREHGCMPSEYRKESKKCLIFIGHFCDKKTFGKSETISSGRIWV